MTMITNLTVIFFNLMVPHQNTENTYAIKSLLTTIVIDSGEQCKIMGFENFTLCKKQPFNFGYQQKSVRNALNLPKQYCNLTKQSGKWNISTYTKL